MKNTIILLTMLLFSGIGFAQESNNGKQLWAKSFLNEKAPELTVETWISKKPDTEGKFVIIDFWATWCGPCQMIGPMIEELAEEFNGKIIIGKVNVDENSDLPSQYGIRNIPTILFFKGGEMVSKLVGAQSKAKLQEEAQKLLD